MEIVLLSGAIKNSGDYLITNRCKNLIQNVYPEVNINTIVGNYSLEEKLDEINRADAIVIAGGPSYTRKLYPRDIPLVADLSRITSKMFIVGSGWYGNLTNDNEIWNYKFWDSSKLLLQRIEDDSKELGCRDYYSVKVLQANGFSSGVMTGCPAWYDLSKIEKRLIYSNEINKIMISDPADASAFGMQSIEIVKLMKKIYPNAEIEYVFHRGTNNDKLTKGNEAKYIKRIIIELEKMEIKYHDIAYGYEGFSLYDSCDLHVGHRVHAHIYNLSERRKSILIEEDSRGAGVNEVLGLWGIKGYQSKMSSNSSSIIKVANKVHTLTRPNPHVLCDLEKYLEYIDHSKGDIFNIAYGLMEHYFGIMIEHIKSIEKYI